DVHDRIRRVPAAFHRMRDGVRALHRIQPDFAVAARCTVRKQNCTSLVATVEAARAMGLRSVSFLAADLTSSAFNRPEGWPIERQAEVGLNADEIAALEREDRKSTRLNSSHVATSYAVFCLKKKTHR